MLGTTRIRFCGRVTPRYTADAPASELRTGRKASTGVSEKHALTGETYDQRRNSIAIDPLLRSGAAAKVRYCGKTSSRGDARRSGHGQRAILLFEKGGGAHGVAATQIPLRKNGGRAARR